ncbi:hypothetical protein Desor_4658 [Desulfosporosinus orientis DSM 765]|uniref:DinB family protein n=1 Tax=Desulfosporosinus orientis (strain ATCC 19365 / DSM 765 / NCIMB 8382 / VKM B-1628 / Singapore I) TaxID=768706 RepID=G7WE86_DESOD|nr:DinB family protein [Desulfosporosinus orientis]AET70062.1 hypothetical protein Desor_4658 [Desulfosporosinus orientis DSM 765]
MFTSLQAFLQCWETESESTLKILNALSDDSLKQAVSEDDRTLGRIAWHITATIPEMIAKTGLSMQSIDEEAPVPSKASTIADSYQAISQTLREEVKKQWTDQTLLEKRDMYGESWTIGTTLTVLIHHQIHHRGQMTVLMRQAGLKVPGIMGPSREEWGQFGMEPPAL